VYSPPYVEPLSAAITPLADFVNSLLGILSVLWDCHTTVFEGTVEKLDGHMQHRKED
jgi:hypothetical protein